MTPKDVRYFLHMLAYAQRAVLILGADICRL